MKSFLVITVTSADRPGIVETVTDVVAAHGGNWEESRLARLGGDFAGIIMVSVPSDRCNELTSALQSLAGDEMTITIKATAPSDPSVPQGHTLCQLRLEGADHEGIVHDVAAYLAKQHINVEAMETEVVSAPMSAAPLFHMQADLSLPPSVAFEELRENLARIGDQLGVNIEVAPAPSQA